MDKEKLIKLIYKDLGKIHKTLNKFFEFYNNSEYHNDIFDRIDKECIYGIFIEIEHYLDHDLEYAFERLDI